MPFGMEQKSQKMELQCNKQNKKMFQKLCYTSSHMRSFAVYFIEDVLKY